MSENTQTKVEQFEFQAEIKQLMHLLAHSLYKNREVFVRELISNAADALEKVRFFITKGDAVADKDSPLEIRIDPDEEKNQLVITDTGIGMTHQELIDNLGQIAHSGTQDFVKRMSANANAEKSEKDFNLIGQFGVGFYSVFIVAEKVEVISKSYLPDEPAHLWTSDGTGSYTLQSLGMTPRGTKIIVHLREDAKEFLSKWSLESAIKKYSNFVPVPIKIKDEQINKTRAIWAEPKSSLKEEDYQEFYKFLSLGSDNPLFYLHLAVDMPVQFHALLYCPMSNPELLGFGKTEHKTHLYARRVMIQQDSEDILPDYLRFFRGIVDCDDLPLNISRETLQENRQMTHVRKALIGKILGYLTDLAKNDADKYKKFWKQFGRVFKEGYNDFQHQDKFKPLVRFNSSTVGVDELVSLDDYVGRMVGGQTEIYFLSGPNRATNDKSPHLEIFRKKGIEVLFLFDPLDEFVVSGLRNYMEKEFKSIDQVNLDKITEIPDKEVTDKKDDAPPIDEIDLKKLLEHIKVTLGESKIKDAVVSKRLTDSPAVLVNPDDGMSSHMQRVMKLMHQDAAVGPRVMEVNAKHPLIRNLVSIYAKDPRHAFINQTCFQLYDNALLMEGFPPDWHEMVTRLQDMMSNASEAFAK